LVVSVFFMFNLSPECSFLQSIQIGIQLG